MGIMRTLRGCYPFLRGVLHCLADVPESRQAIELPVYLIHWAFAFEFQQRGEQDGGEPGDAVQSPAGGEMSVFPFEIDGAVRSDVGLLVIEFQFLEMQGAVRNPMIHRHRGHHILVKARRQFLEQVMHAAEKRDAKELGLADVQRT